jgi:hypothetical protein
MHALRANLSSDGQMIIDDEGHTMRTRDGQHEAG